MPFVLQQNYNEMTPRTVIFTRPPIKVPSPFEFNILEFLPRKSIGCKTSNAFMIYRKVYVKTLLKQEFHSKMTEASCWAAESWSEESDEVKNDFKKFAEKLKEIYRNKSREALEAKKSKTNITIENDNDNDNDNYNDNNNNLKLISNDELLTFENPIYPNEYFNIDELIYQQLTHSTNMANYEQQNLIEYAVNLPMITQDINQYDVNMNYNAYEYNANEYNANEYEYYYDEWMSPYEISITTCEPSIRLPSIFGTR